MRPAWRLDDQQQAKVEAAWDSILAHSDQIDRSLLLDLLIVGDLPELGVDEIDLTARKRLSGGGIAVMETHYRRDDKTNDRWIVTILDPSGGMVRSESYTYAEMDAREAYLNANDEDPDAPDLNTDERARRIAAREDRAARLKLVSEILAPLHTATEPADPDPQPVEAN